MPWYSDVGNWINRNVINPVFDAVGSAFGVSNAGQNIGSMVNNAFNPTGAQNAYNSEEAEKYRNWAEQQTSVVNAYNSQEAEKYRNWSAAENEKNRLYQTEMSNTAYQRAVADMRAAGLNPYAVYGGASAASSPAGSAGGGSAASGYSMSGSSAHSAGHATGLLGRLVTTAFQLGLQG